MSTSYQGRLGSAPEESVKAPCVAATSTNITLSGEQTLTTVGGNVTVTTGQRVLVTSQTDSTQNGIYIVNNAAWTRATDWNDGEDVISGQLILAPDFIYQSNFSGSYTPDTTPVTFNIVISLYANTRILDTTGDHYYQIVPGELTANRNVTLPVLAANDEFVFSTHSQSLTNKAIDASVIGGVTPAEANFTTVTIGSGSGATPSGSADELIVDGATDSGLTIASGAVNSGYIFFADSGSASAGYVRYNHSINSMYFGTFGAEQVVIDSSGNMTVNSGYILASSNSTNVVGDFRNTNSSGYGVLIGGGSSVNYALQVRDYANVNLFSVYGDRVDIDGIALIVGTPSGEHFTVTSDGGGMYFGGTNIGDVRIIANNTTHITLDGSNNTSFAGNVTIDGNRLAFNNGGTGVAGSFYASGSVLSAWAGANGFTIWDDGGATKHFDIDDEGIVSLNNTMNISKAGDSSTAHFVHVIDSNFGNIVYRARATRAANSNYDFFYAESSNGSDVEFRLNGAGNGQCDGSWTGGGADYAEYFEWQPDHVPTRERHGVSVVLESGGLRPANDDEIPFAVISANPSVIGDNDMQWRGKYIRTVYGNYALDSNGNRVLNPAFDPSREHESRGDRMEWATTGLLGKLRINKTSPIAPNWIKMRDIDADVAEYFIFPVDENLYGEMEALKARCDMLESLIEELQLKVA